MNLVVIYAFEARYSGNAKYAFSVPDVGATHNCFLFMAQHSDEEQYDSALAECRNYGFSEVVFSGCGLLQTELLDTDQYRRFTGFYEEALREGSSLVYYPNA